MALFICKKCGTIENTSLCSYWCLAMEDEWEWSEELKDYKGEKCLCSECAKIQYYKDKCGGIVVPGKWHNRFPKEYPSEEEIQKMKKELYITR